MPDQVGNPEDRFSQNEAQSMMHQEVGIKGMSVKPQSHIHDSGHGRATVHPDLSNRGALA